MQIIDYVIIGIAVIGLIIGLVRGLIEQLLTLLGIVAVAVGTSYLFRFPVQWLSGIIPNEKVTAIVSIIITAIVLAVIYGVIASLVKKPFKKVKVLKSVDKILGGVLGVAIVYALVALFVAAMSNEGVTFFAKLRELLSAQLENSVIINMVYGNNFFGDWILNVIISGLQQIMPPA